MDDLQKNDVSSIISDSFQIPWGHNQEIIPTIEEIEVEDEE